MDSPLGEGTEVPLGDRNQQGPAVNTDDASANHASAEDAQTTKSNTAPNEATKVRSSRIAAFCKAS